MSNVINEGSVPWREWNDDAFREARELDRPVLLDIGAVWCHWCHVMDHGIAGDPMHTGTYSNSEVIRLIKEHFIPIKVDNDRRPDINARYTMGGWPSTVFLNPNGEILYGETYVHPGRMISLLEYISDLWTKKRDQISAQTQEVRDKRAQETYVTGDLVLDPKTVSEVAASLNRSFDPLHGGFGKEPKFPHPAALLFAVERSAEDGQMRRIAEKTLDGMADGGMFDQFAGGFFRYSTTRDWSVPHYEKMLEDNARLVSVYATASAALGEPRYADIVRWVHSWLLNDMRDPSTGAFAGSQDADEEERYYGRPLDERATMPTPYIDRTVYCSWNALAVTALIDSSLVLDDPNLITEAERTYRFILDKLTERAGSPNEWTGRLITQRYWDGNTAGGASGLLSGQTELANASLALYESTGNLQYLVDAAQSANTILETLISEDSGGFMDLAPHPDAIGELARPNVDIGDNSETALMLLRLSSLTGNPKPRLAASRALTFFSDDYGRLGLFAAAYARAVSAALTPAPHIAIVGKRAEIAALQKAAWEITVPGKTVEILLLDDSGNAVTYEGVERPNALTKELASGGGPKAYLCIGDRCLAPVNDPEALRHLLKEYFVTR